jgi:serine-type D-Ala-D-Ala carboxypeptidase
VKAFLDDFVASGTASSAVALAGAGDHIAWELAAGDARPGRAATPDARFDLASLTKPFVATLALVLDSAAVLPLASRLGEIWPQIDPKRRRTPLSDLLRHCSGLLAWRPLYHLCRSREDVLALLLDGASWGARRATYSDLGYILWGMTAERITGVSLHDLVRVRVLEPLGLGMVEPSPGDRPEVAQSFMGTDKEPALAARQGLAIPPLPPPPIGMPQDGNARFLVGLGGRMAGHAGLFGRASDLWALGAEWLSPGRLLHPEAVAAALAGGGSFALGWWRRTLRGSAGRSLSRDSFGHTGFAGGSLWIDPVERRILVLLGSRTDPSSDMNHWRRRFHTLASTTIPSLEATAR